jgi:predicted TIM-barrel fold metal-dependent hydrolase
MPLGKQNRIRRRQFLGYTAAGVAGLAGCSDDPAPGRYTQADIDLLTEQRRIEAATRGQSRFGEQRFSGYRGLAALPWFDLDANGRLVCIDDSLPGIVDVHAHLGMSFLFKPKLDLQASTPRVRHLLDCDATRPGCDFDLDVYINGNFSQTQLDTLQRTTLTQGLWGNAVTRTHTLPNLLREMDAMKVEHAFVLPIKLGLPFGDDLTEQWRAAIARADAGRRVIAGLSVHPDDPQRIGQLQAHAATGARMVKLHPTVQQFYPDDPKMMPIYEEAQRLGLVVFFHGGRAGIEPEKRQRYAMPRHYAAVLENFPQLPVILGHAGARDSDAMLELALQHQNAWLGIHGQSISSLDKIIERTRGQRLLFGTDWPWYHLAATLAKVLLCTDTPARAGERNAILRGNALRLFPELMS